MKQPNTVFLCIFEWFIAKYSKTTTKDCESNQKRMVTDWHPSDSFEPFAVRLFIGASYASTVLYPMKDCDLINFWLQHLCQGVQKMDLLQKTRTRQLLR